MQASTMLSRIFVFCALIIVSFVEINCQHNHTQMRFRNGRRVCTTIKEVYKPIIVTEAYPKPVSQKFQRKCENNQMCNGAKFIYETAYRDVYKPNYDKIHVYTCCPGHADKPSYGCHEPRCTHQCENGGTCSGLNRCQCTPGFTGKYCEVDIDECVEEKPCDHFCFNTKGSYYCTCKNTFTLQDDKQSCRKDSNDVGGGSEIEELDYDILDKRVVKLEKMLGIDDSLETSIEINVIDMKYELDNVAKNIKRLESKVKELEFKQPRRMKSRHHPRFQRYETK